MSKCVYCNIPTRKAVDSDRDKLLPPDEFEYVKKHALICPKCYTEYYTI